MTDDIIHNK